MKTAKLVRLLKKDSEGFVNSLSSDAVPGCEVLREQVVVSQAVIDASQQDYKITGLIYIEFEESSPAMQVLEARRDRALMGIVSLVQGYNQHWDSGMLSAANDMLSAFQDYEIYSLFESYGTVAGKATIVSNFVSGLSTVTTLQNALDMLGLLEWRIELDAANDAIIAAM